MNHNFKDLTGKKFNKLLVLYKTKKDKNGHYYWKCKCDCGNEKEILGTHLLQGTIKSCGCYNSEQVSKRAKTKQIIPNKRIRHIWELMKSRCYNNKNISFKNYGDRGIKICDEWLDKKNGLINFYNWSMENGYREDLSIDRIDIDGNYEPSNCRWVSWKKQCNNKRNNIKIKYNGESENVCYFIQKYSLNKFAIYSRLRKGWSIKDAIEKPINEKKSNTGEFGISFLKDRNKYSLFLKGKYIGNFNTLKEAINKREEILNGVK